MTLMEDMPMRSLPRTVAPAGWPWRSLSKGFSRSFSAKSVEDLSFEKRKARCFQRPRNVQKHLKTTKKHPCQEPLGNGL